MRRYSMYDEWENSAYDEDGNAVSCDGYSCDGELKWDPTRALWVCPECGKEFDRYDFFSYIGAQPPGSFCTSCSENYPFCKKTCSRYDIDPNDPMLD